MVYNIRVLYNEMVDENGTTVDGNLLKNLRNLEV